MLSSTYKLGDDFMIVDSKDLRNYGIDLKTGQVTNIETAFENTDQFVCSVSGCIYCIYFFFTKPPIRSIETA